MQLNQKISHLRSRISLRIAVILAVVFGLVVPAVLITPYQLKSVEANARNKQNDEHKRLTEILSVILSEPVWQITPEIAKASSEVVYSDPRVAEILVITLPDQKTFLLNNSRMPQQKGPFKIRSEKIMHSDQVIGEVFLKLADDELNRSLDEDLKRTLTLTGISLLLAVLFIMMVLVQIFMLNKK